jgi:hypothetical protein
MLTATMATATRIIQMGRREGELFVMRSLFLCNFLINFPINFRINEVAGKFERRIPETTKET